MAPVDDKSHAIDAAKKMKDNVGDQHPVLPMGGDASAPARPRDLAPALSAGAPMEYDAVPLYVMSMFCGGAGAHAFSAHPTFPRIAAIAAGFSAAYAAAGYLVQNGHARMGYDMGTLASLGLLAAVGKRARHTGDGVSVALTTGGAMAAAQGVYKSWLMRAHRVHS